MLLLFMQKFFGVVNLFKSLGFSSGPKRFDKKPSEMRLEALMRRRRRTT
jgi:hypothetical protein